MNKRTGDLIKQARMEWIQCEQVDKNVQAPGIYYHEDVVSRFAELIIDECIETITAYDLVPGHSAKWEDIYEIHARLLQDLGEEIKEHFGIKENT